jgi:adenylyltransferase/sulfurtransferase
MPVLPGESACLACIFPEPPSGAQPTCDTAGVLNVITSLVASLQVADALKILSGRQDRVDARLLTADVWNNSFRTVATHDRDPDCAVCGRRQFTHLEARRRRPVSLCGRNAVQVQGRNQSLNLDALRASLEPLGAVRANPYALRFFCSPYEMTIFPDGRAIIKGTEDAGVARSLYARYVGS